MIEVENLPDSVVMCRPVGRLDFATSMPFRHLIADLSTPGLSLIVDLQYVQAMDAVGASAIVGVVRRVRSLGGTVHLRNANPRIVWYLTLLRIDQFLERAAVGTPCRVGDRP